MSTKTAHTPGPWEVSSSLYVVSPLGRVVAKCDGMRVADLDAPAPQMFANAARIVACVNACEGIADPASLLEQNRVLRAALERIANYEGLISEKVQDIARAALAKSQGGQP